MDPAEILKKELRSIDGSISRVERDIEQGNRHLDRLREELKLLKVDRKTIDAAVRAVEKLK